MTKLDTEQKAHSSNYAGGEKAGQSWTDKVMGVKQTSDPPSSLPQDQLEGVDDDEWVGLHDSTSTLNYVYSSATVLYNMSAVIINYLLLYSCRMIRCIKMSQYNISSTLILQTKPWTIFFFAFYLV